MPEEEQISPVDERARATPKLVRRLHAHRERYQERSFIYRALFTAAGFTVLLAGLAMVVFPGPALIVIPVGLAMLSLQFAWAGTLLEKALERAAAAKESASEASTAQKVITAVAATLAVGAFIVAAIVYDIPILPF